MWSNIPAVGCTAGYLDSPPVIRDERVKRTNLARLPRLQLCLVLPCTSWLPSAPCPVVWVWVSVHTLVVQHVPEQVSRPCLFAYYK